MCPVPAERGRPGWGSRVVGVVPLVMRLALRYIFGSCAQMPRNRAKSPHKPRSLGIPAIPLVNSDRLGPSRFPNLGFGLGRPPHPPLSTRPGGGAPEGESAHRQPLCQRRLKMSHVGGGRAYLVVTSLRRGPRCGRPRWGRGVVAAPGVVASGSCCPGC